MIRVIRPILITWVTTVRVWTNIKPDRGGKWVIWVFRVQTAQPVEGPISSIRPGYIPKDLWQQVLRTKVRVKFRTRTALSSCAVCVLTTSGSTLYINYLINTVLWHCALQWSGSAHFKIATKPEREQQPPRVPLVNRNFAKYTFWFLLFHFFILYWSRAN